MSGLVILVVLLSIGASLPLTTNMRAQGTTTLRVGFLAGIESMNPFRGINDADYLFYGLVYDYLFALDEDGNPRPNIATAAVQDAYGANWTYTIRSGIEWHDGTPLTLDDVKFSVNLNIENFGQLWAYEPYVNRIVQCAAGQTTGCGAQITGPDQVTVYFDRPFVPGKSLYVPIVKQAQWDPLSLNAIQYTYENLNPIGTGMYSADANIGSQWTNGEPLLLHRNANYHVGVPAIDDIYLTQYSDEASMVQALIAGALDVAELTPAGYGALAGQANIDRQEAILSTQYWVEIGFQQLDQGGVNSQLNPARWDQNVRRALAMATNKDYIVNTIYQGKGIRGSSLMSPITPNWFYDPANPAIEPDPSVNLTFNIQAANDLLDATGYDTKDGQGYRSATNSITVYDDDGEPKTVPAGTRLTFAMAVRQEYPQERDTAAYLVDQWRQVGVELTYTVMDEPALSNAVYGGDVETYIWYWSGDPDPNYLLSIQSGFTLDGWSDNYWNNATYNQYYVDHLAATVPADREAIVRAAEKLHYESAVYIILVYNMGQWGYRTDQFTGWGNWADHPYRQLNAFWTANPLFLDLRPLAAPDVAVASLSGRPGTSVTITGTITDPATGTWTLDFGDTSAPATGTYPAGGGTISETHTYTVEGTYMLRLTADNAGYSRTATGTVTIQATGNLQPSIAPLAADATTGPPGTTVVFTLTGRDPDGGSLTFTIDFDDGSNPESKAVSNVAPDTDATATFSHTYNEVGSHFATANVSDGELVSSNQRLEIAIQAVQQAPQGGVDARILGGALLIVIVAVVALALIMRSRARRKEESELRPPPPQP